MPALRFETLDTKDMVLEKEQEIEKLVQQFKSDTRKYQTYLTTPDIPLHDQNWTNGDLILLAYSDEICVGYVRCALSEFLNTFQFKEIYVISSWRSKGIAKTMVKQCATFYITRYKTLYAVASNLWANRNGYKLLRTMGFAPHCEMCSVVLNSL